MSNNDKPFENLSTLVREYISLKVDEYKLRGVEGLSHLFNTVLVVIVTTVVAGVALQMLGLAAGYAIGALLDSTATGFAIMGALFAIVALTLFLLRKRLFINPLIRLFVKLFFDQEQK